MPAAVKLALTWSLGRQFFCVYFSKLKETALKCILCPFFDKKVGILKKLAWILAKNSDRKILQSFSIFKLNNINTTVNNFDIC